MRTVHVYHHFESPPCPTCGYRSNTGYYDEVGMSEHIIHIVNDSSVLFDRMLKQSKKKKAKK